MSAANKCVRCGHTVSDHADGYMGGALWTRDGQQSLCHQDDHSCYVPSPDGPLMMPFGELTSVLSGDARGRIQAGSGAPVMGRVDPAPSPAPNTTEQTR